MSMRILVADDDEDMAEVLRLSLATLGHVVVTCATARETIEQLSSSEFDGVLLDLTMPDLSAEKLVEGIAAIENHPPIVVFSARSAREARQHALKLGAALLPKPCELDDLLATIAATFRNKSSRTPASDELEAR